MGKSYAFLVLAICLSSTVTSCAKTENNKTEEDFFAQEKMGNENKEEESERNFTDDFIYAIENMDNGKAKKTGEESIEKAETRENEEEDLRERTDLISRPNQESEGILFSQQAMISLKAIADGSEKSIKMKL